MYVISVMIDQNLHLQEFFVSLVQMSDTPTSIFCPAHTNTIKENVFFALFFFFFYFWVLCGNPEKELNEQLFSLKNLVPPPPSKMLFKCDIVQAGKGPTDQSYYMNE